MQVDTCSQSEHTTGLLSRSTDEEPRAQRGEVTPKVTESGTGWQSWVSNQM